MINTAFSNISVILWHPILLVEETGVSEKTTDKTLLHNVVLSTPRPSRIQTRNESGDRL